MSDLRNMVNRGLRDAIGTRCHTRAIANFQNGTATYDLTVIGTAANMQYTIDGVTYSIAAGTDKVLATLSALQTPVTGQAGYYVIPVSTTVLFLAVINAAGTIYFIQGPYSGQSQTNASGLTRTVGATEASAIPFIEVPATYCPFGVLKVVNGVTAAFTVGTTFWDATNVTSSWAPIAQIPSVLANLVYTAGGA